MKNVNRAYSDRRRLVIQYNSYVTGTAKETNETFNNVKSEEAVKRILNRRAKKNMKRVTYGGEPFIHE